MTLLVRVPHAPAEPGVEVPSSLSSALVGQLLDWGAVRSEWGTGSLAVTSVGLVLVDDESGEAVAIGWSNISGMPPRSVDPDTEVVLPVSVPEVGVIRFTMSGRLLANLAAMSTVLAERAVDDDVAIRLVDTSLFPTKADDVTSEGDLEDFVIDLRAPEAEAPDANTEPEPEVLDLVAQEARSVASVTRSAKAQASASSSPRGVEEPDEQQTSLITIASPQQKPQEPAVLSIALEDEVSILEEPTPELDKPVVAQPPVAKEPVAKAPVAVSSGRRFYRDPNFWVGVGVRSGRAVNNRIKGYFS